MNNDSSTDQELHSLQTYVSDLLALEQHIGKPFASQAESESVAVYPAAKDLVSTLASQNTAHEAALRACLESLGGHPASPIKSAWSTLLGDAASAVGGSRKTKVTKYLRDDYTALSLATMSYTLLHSTAVGVGNASVAALALQGLSDYAGSVMEINQVVPGVVLAELREDGENVAVGSAETIVQQTNAVWQRQGGAVHQS
jgi:hypothetical protein